MNPREVEYRVELALRKQRLQLRAQAERAGLLGGLERIETVLGVADQLRSTAQGLCREAPLIVAGAALLLVLRPRLALRTARRAWLSLRAYRYVRRTLAPLATLFRPHSGE